MKQTTYYLCDPEKNTECKRKGCAYARGRGKARGECTVTPDIKCAVLSDKGFPMIAFVEMRGEDDGTD